MPTVSCCSSRWGLTPYSVSFPSSVVWMGPEPEYEASKVYEIVLRTYDQGRPGSLPVGVACNAGKADCLCVSVIHGCRNTHILWCGLHLYEKLPVFYQLQLLDRAPGLFSIGIRLMFMDPSLTKSYPAAPTETEVPMSTSATPDFLVTTGEQTCVAYNSSYTKYGRDL